MSKNFQAVVAFKNNDLITASLAKATWLIKQERAFVGLFSLLMAFLYGLIFYLPDIIQNCIPLNIAFSVLSCVLMTIVLNIQRMKHFSILDEKPISFFKIIKNSFSREDIIMLKKTVQENIILAFVVTLGMGVIFVLFGLFFGKEENWSLLFFNSLLILGVSVGAMLARFLIRLYNVFHEYSWVFTGYPVAKKPNPFSRDFFKNIFYFCWMGAKVLCIILLLKLPAFVFINKTFCHLLLIGLGTVLSMSFLSSIGWVLKNNLDNRLGV